MKGIFIIIGESFRLGGQGTRVRGVPESYDQQINALNSHIKFLNYLEQKYHCSCDIFFSTYNTKYNNEINKIYNKHLVGFKNYDDVIGLTKLFKNSILQLDSKIHNYDFLLYFRIDLFLKDRFSEVFNPLWNEIRFPTICWKKDSVYNGKPRVNDMMLFVPKRFFNNLHNIQICHESWFLLNKNCKISDNDMEVMINTYHDSDSQKDKNPLYYIVNRPESDKWHSENDIFTKTIETFIDVKKKLKNNLGLNLVFLLIFFLILIKKFEK
jgi:hypothetical protein